MDLVQYVLQRAVKLDSGRGYVCPVCGEILPDYGELREHVIDHCAYSADADKYQ